VQEYYTWEDIANAYEALMHAQCGAQSAGRRAA